MVPAQGGCQLLNARCAGGASSRAVKPTGQAHPCVRLPKQIKPIDKDRRRSGEPQRLSLGVGANPSEPNIDCGSTDGIEGMPQPLPQDRQAGAALDEPYFNVHPSIMRYEIVCSKYSDAATGQAVRAFLQSTVGQGQADLEDFGYFPLPAEFQSKVASAVNAIA